MPKKERTAKQLANDERLRNKAVELEPLKETERPATPDMSAMQKQMDEIMETNALLKAALLNGTKGDGTATPAVDKKGQLTGQFEKYVTDPDQYPSPVARVSEEPRLKPLAFDYNYKLEYEYTTRQYETKQGVNTVEPEFTVTLWKNMLDDDGKVTKRYRARRMVFHEDPGAALVIARDNNVQIDATDERSFLNEMRYLRVRDWLFDIFWPKPAQDRSNQKEEVIGNQLVTVVTVNSEEESDLSGQLSKTDKFRTS